MMPNGISHGKPHTRALLSRAIARGPERDLHASLSRSLLAPDPNAGAQNALCTPHVVSANERKPAANAASAICSATESSPPTRVVFPPPSGDELAEVPEVPGVPEVSRSFSNAPRAAAAADAGAARGGRGGGRGRGRGRR